MPAQVNKLTPVLVVESIEPCLAFWIERLGFTKSVEVPGPDGKALGFVILQQGAIELMFQSRASIAHDVPGLGNVGGSAALFLEVESLAPIRAAVAGLPVTVPERETFYGTREIGVREPGGHAVTFAEFVKKPGS